MTPVSYPNKNPPMAAKAVNIFMRRWTFLIRVSVSYSEDGGSSSFAWKCTCDCVCKLECKCECAVFVCRGDDPAEDIKPCLSAPARSFLFSSAVAGSLFIS